MHTEYILRVRNTVYRRRHNTRAICTTPLQFILGERLHYGVRDGQIMIRFGRFLFPSSDSQNQRHKSDESAYTVKQLRLGLLFWVWSGTTILLARRNQVVRDE